eukprot:TRINITY_DN10262_c0_g1_i1.p1 TRINITY_DN10262_c0_g1~~TRINITY_DN10262_c0_g1_i1.p1  ORF type:complete len:380 (-),score=73.60 TRINITY_DN10262_c0_g1_i1:224-1363(-)
MKDQVRQMREDQVQSLGEREAEFDAVCAAKRARLEELSEKEHTIQERVMAIKAAEAERVQLDVGGQIFVTTSKSISRAPHSVLATLWHEHRKKGTSEPLFIDVSPSLFEPILEYLRTGTLRLVPDTTASQIQQVAEQYSLDELADMCSDASKRLDTPKVMQLLNGRRNLSGSDMRLLDLSEMDFRGASLYRSRAAGAKLQWALLSGKDTDLTHASFVDASMEQCDLSHACAKHANLSGARLEDAVLVGAQLQAAEFNSTNMTRANMSSANLDGAHLKGACLEGAEMQNVVLAGADLTDAQAGRANIPKANFRNANMTRSCLDQAVLASADLRGVDLASASLVEADLTGAKLAGALNLGTATFDNLRGQSAPGWTLTALT